MNKEYLFRGSVARQSSMDKSTAELDFNDPLVGGGQCYASDQRGLACHDQIRRMSTGYGT
jgi:hypothetical protein